MKLALGLAVFFASSVALANGRYPQSGQIAVDPENPQHLLVRATYGVLVSDNHGGSWSWICEPSIGYPPSSSEDPSLAIAHGGTFLAGLFEGLTISHDGGCSFEPYSELKKRYVVDLAVDKLDPTKGVLVFSVSTGPTTFLTQLWETTDGAVTWAKTGVDLPNDFIALTVDTAPSDPNRVYMSGRVGSPTYGGVLQRSDDRGAHWTQLAIQGADEAHLPFVGAVDPTNEDRLYARLDSEKADELVYSSDGGMTWQSAFHSVGNLYAFAMSPDGSEVAIGGDQDGVWIAPTTTMQFTKRSKLGCYCLTWTPAGLYACAKEAIDGFEVGLSTDEAATFTPLSHLPDLCGPLSCPVGTSTQRFCPNLWGSTKIAIGSTCGDTGGGGASSATAGAGGASGGGSASSHSGCAVSEREGDASLALAVAAGLFAAAGGRRRRLAAHARMS